MKHIELFNNGFDLTVQEKIKPENWPYIGRDVVTGEIVYTIVPEPWVTFTAEEDNSSIGLNALSTNHTLKYSTDTTTWSNFDTTNNIPLNNGDKVYVRGILSADNTTSNYTQFKMSGRIAASGNCNAIWNYQDLNAPLKEYCGYFMFRSCSSLTTVPELPATTLANYCYYYMFGSCTSLTTAPELPATELATGCYQCMFNWCTSLTTTPELLATELATNCYALMFSQCTSLTTAPELPATELATNCYKNMFNGCGALTTTPVLRATILVEGCYYGMFAYCKSLTTAPELPAAELVKECYREIFKECNNLNYIKCLATNIHTSMNVYMWVSNVSSTGTFVKHPNMSSWSTGYVGIPNGWTVVDAEL